LQSRGINNTSLFHLNDDKNSLFNSLKTILDNHPIIIISGGVSKGKFDYVPQVLADLKIKKIFHKVKQRPGKPFWFGTAIDGKTIVFALPGNPVSTLVCLNRYVIPALLKANTLDSNSLSRNIYAELIEKVTFKKPLTYFLPVKLDHTVKGKLRAKPLKLNGSGDYVGFSKSDGILELPSEKDEFYPGEIYKIFLWGI